MIWWIYQWRCIESIASIDQTYEFLFWFNELFLFYWFAWSEICLFHRLSSKKNCVHFNANSNELKIWSKVEFKSHPTILNKHGVKSPNNGIRMHSTTYYVRNRPPENSEILQITKKTILSIPWHFLLFEGLTVLEVIVVSDKSNSTVENWQPFPNSDTKSKLKFSYFE